MASRFTKLANTRRLIIPVSTLLLCLTPNALAGVTFTDIAEGDSAGITYRRIRSPTSAAMDAIKLRPVFAFNDNVESPFRSRGAPGVALLDYDRDGDLDVFVTNGPGRNNSLYQNQHAQGGGLTFVDVAEGAGVAAANMDGTGVCFGDVDNDGDDDLLVLGRMEPNRFFVNKGDGTFEDKTAPSGLGGGFVSHTSCSMGDINGDGKLDIVVANTFDWARVDAFFIELFGYNHANQLYLNQGGNVFADVSKSSGFLVLENVPPGDATITWSVAMVDYDLDGDLDIVQTDDQAVILPSFLAGVDRGYIQIFNNDGAGHFRNVTRALGTNNPMSWMGVSFGDINCDGFMDFFATNIGSYMVPQQGGSLPPNIAASQWFLGSPDGFIMSGFLPPGTPGALSFPATPFGWGTGMADADNDGDTDILYAGGMDVDVFLVADNPGVVLLNDACSGNFTWDQASTAATAERTQRSEVIGMALGDLNDDGFVDMVYPSAQTAPADRLPLVPFFMRWGSPFDAVARHVPMFAPLGGPDYEWAGRELDDGHLFVLKNSGNDNRWVKVTLTGSIGLTSRGKVNRSGIGAVAFFTPESGKRVMSPVLGGSSHESQHALEQVFGLGSAAKGTLEVLWPGGTRNRVYDLGSGERLTMPEIPCSFTGTWADRRSYVSCVDRALIDLRGANVITNSERQRLRQSAVRAYDDTH